MAFVEAADDPLRAAADATSLLLRTLGSAESAASPSRARGALLGGSVVHKGSKELVEQARLAMKERGDIQKLYQEDGVKVAATAATNSKNNQQGRRPALDRKRARFTLKAPTSNTVQNVDFSQLLSIEDPEEYFSTLEQLEKADREIKKLRGEVPTKPADSHRAIEPPMKRPGMSRRQSVHSYKFSAGTATQHVTEAPASQIGTITEPLFTQDDMPASVPERTELLVPSSSSQCDIPDVSVRKDSFAEKDRGAAWDYLMSEFKILDEYEEENLLREKLQLKEISIGKVCLPDLFNVPGDRPVSSTTVRKSPTSGHTPERPVSGSHHTRISQWEKHIFAGDILKDKADLSEDDESDGSPETVLGKRSLVHGSYDAVVLTTDEASNARETTSPNVKSPDHVLEPEPNVSNGVSTDEREPGNFSLGAYRDSEVSKERDASSRHSVPLEEDDVPMDHPVIEKPNHETEVSSHHLEGNSTEVLGSTPGRNACALHEEDENFEHQGVVGGNRLLRDKPIRPPEIPPEDIDPHNQSHIHNGNVERRAVDISNELSLSKDGRQKAVQKGNNKKQPSKRGKRVADEASHPLKIPPANIDPETPRMQDINVEEVVGGKGLRDDVSHPLGIPPANFDPDTQPHMRDTNIEQQTVGTSDPRSPKKGRGRKEAQRRNKRQELNGRKSLAAFGLAWQSGVRRSTRIRSRPLQDWLGERFLYGRIHDTMATVIGIKSYSPSQDGKAAMRVKSFVPERYSDIVAQVAKY